MRNLFIVLAKVVGLLQIPTAINYFVYMNFSFAETARSNRHWMDDIGKNSLVFAASCAGVGLILGLAWAFLFRTTWITDRLGLPEGEMNWPEPSSLLYVGIKLLGLYVLVGAITILTNDLIYSRFSLMNYWGRVIPMLLKFALGLLLVLKTTKIIEWISRDSQPKDIVSA